MSRAACPPIQRGLVIALVGPEATGKSTLARELTAWLASQALPSPVTVRSIHVGKPPAGWLTWPVQSLAPWLRRSLPRYRTSYLEGHADELASQPVDTTPAPTGERSSEAPQPRPSLLTAIRAVCVAWDRRRLLHKCHRAARRQTVIVCDRYPSVAAGGVDGARLSPIPRDAGLSAAVHNRLARIEARLYRTIPAPDVVFQLQVSLATALKRNQARIKTDKGGAHYIASRHRRAKTWTPFAAESIYPIDTENSLPDTLRQIQQALMAYLQESEPQTPTGQANPTWRFNPGK